MKVIFKTNLDLHCAERWPEIDFVPPVGTRIHSKMRWDNDMRLVLEVTNHEIVKDGTLEVELHIPKMFHHMTLLEWYRKVYEPICKQHFI